MQPSLLIVEDNANLALGLKTNFEVEGFQVTVVGDGLEAERCIPEIGPDVILLDIGLPKLDGFGLLERLRERGVTIPPVVILSARTMQEDVVQGFDLGATDYIEKPFDTIKLIASVNARLPASKRVKLSMPIHLPVEVGGHPGVCIDPTTGCVHFGNCTVDPIVRRVFRGGREVHLRPKEFDLLWYFLNHPGEVLSINRLHAEVWEVRVHMTSPRVKITVRRLRLKIEDEPDHPRHIITVRGHGYRFDPPTQTSAARTARPGFPEISD